MTGVLWHCEEFVRAAVRDVAGIGFVRTFMTPAIAALMGKWFWWPTIVRSRAAMRVPPPPEPAEIR